MSSVDKFCGDCGAPARAAAPQQVATQPVVTQPPAAAAQSQGATPAKRFSLWYPGTTFGCLFYLAAVPVSGLIAMSVAEGSIDRLPLFVLGCILAYPILTMWRIILRVRGALGPSSQAANGEAPVGHAPASQTNANQPQANPVHQKPASKGAGCGAILLTVLAIGFGMKCRRDAIRDMRPTNPNRWTAPARPNNPRPRTRPSGGVRQRAKAVESQRNRNR